ncbi:MAG: hypothetical protein KIC76_02310 [Firmicutes bacterium]|nr:hypothetical protein [Bacillota bacterium]
MKNKKQAIILSVIASIVLLVLIVGATYAYFQASGGTGTSANLRVTTYTTDVFNFEVGNDISIYADATSFASGKGNASGSTFAKAILTANSKTNTATKYYYLYLNISKNTFNYTQDTNTPEILLSIKDGSNNEITSINDLTYKTVTDGSGATIKGFDITTGIGLITLFNNREITANPQKTDTWNVTVTFINYDTDQSKNAGKSFNAKLIAQQNGISDSVSDYCKSGDNLANCIISLGAPDIFGATKVYHHDENLVNGANDNSYRYAGGDNTCRFNGENVQGAYSNATFGASNENDCKKVYTIKSDALTIWTDNSVTRLLSDEKPVTWTDGACKTTDGESVNVGFDKGNFDAVTEATCKGNSYIVKTDNLTARVANLNMEYAGVGKWNRVNNFVCFGTSETPCPTDNLYRIIGVIDGKVKLIKYDYATSALLGTDGDYQGSETPNSIYKGSLTSIDQYYWNKTTGTNTWSESNLNKINLNTNFINNIGSTWANKIATTTWKVGGNTWTNIAESVPSIAYQNEIVSPAENTPYDAKIGLMYASDYGFAASPSALTTTLFNYSGNDANGTSIKTINWMYMGFYEWTISRNSDRSSTALNVSYVGNVYNNYVGNSYGVRPSFNLSSSITYVSGSGSMSDPIRVN